MTGSPLYVTVLFLRQPGGAWVAQALEFDLAAQGADIERTKRAFERTFLGQLEFDRRRGRVPLSQVPKAPEKYWRMFHSLRQTQFTTERIADVPPETPPAFMVQAFPDAMNQLGLL